MSDTVRTRDQLVAEFPDNDLGEIPAQASRDLVVSAFGFPSVTDPTADWDNVDSAGVGAFFDSGSFVLNTRTQVEWRCYGGSPHTAIWQPSYNGIPPIPPPTVVAAGTHISVSYDGIDTYTVSATGGGASAPLLLQPPNDTDYGVTLKQHSATQSGNLLQFEDSSGTVGAGTINAKGEFTNAGPIGVSPGTQNERFGVGAGDALGVAANNAFFGWHAGHAMSTGAGNTAMGANALAANFNGSGNVAIGGNALGNYSGDGSIGIGGNAAFQTNGPGNIAIGNNAHAYPNSQSGNIAIGQFAMYNFVTGSDNVAIGINSGNAGLVASNTLVGPNTNCDGSGPYSYSSALGASATITANHQVMLGTPAEQVVHPGSTFLAAGPAGAMFVPASYAVLNGTPLSGLLPIGPITPSPGDRILTWDGASATTWGVYNAAAGAWTRVADMPAGRVYIGPAYVWVADEAFLLAGMGSLIALEPLSGPGIGNPPTWTLGTDSPDWHYAVPTSKTQSGTFINVVITSTSHGQFDYSVNYTGPLSLNDWAIFGGDLDPTLIDWTTWPPAAVVPASNVGSGYPYVDLTGAPTPVGTDGGNVTVVTTSSYVTIINVTAPNGIIGVFMIRNLGPNTGRIRVTTDDPFQGVQVNTTGIGSGSDNGPNDLCQAGGILSLGRPPFTSLQVEVEDFIAGNHTSMLIAWALVEC